MSPHVAKTIRTTVIPFTKEVASTYDSPRSVIRKISSGEETCEAFFSPAASPLNSKDSSYRTSPAAHCVVVSHPDEFRCLGDYYSVQKEICSGQFGTVYRCASRVTGEMLACKTLLKSNIQNDDASEVLLEALIMEALRGCPNVVKLVEVLEDSLAIHFIMELCDGGDLFEFLSHNGALTERDAAQLCVKLVIALSHCHAKGIVHRDLKPENVMLKKSAGEGELEVRLIDFGLATFLRSGTRCSDLVGTIGYTAPEVLLGNYNATSDLFGLGCVLYAALSCSIPFKGRDDYQVAVETLNSEASFSSSNWKNVSTGAKDLVKGLLQKDPSNRYSLRNVLNHPWIVRHSM